MNTFFNQKKLALTIFIILGAFSGWLFIAGQKAIEKSKATFSVLAFENTADQFFYPIKTKNGSDFKPLNFFIENKENKKNNYVVNCFLDKEKLIEKTLTLNAKEKKVFFIKEEINALIGENLESKLEKIPAENFPIEFRVEITQDKNHEEIYKKIIYKK